MRLYLGEAVRLGMIMSWAGEALPVLAQGRAQQRVRPDLQAKGVLGDGAAGLAEQHAAGVAVHLPQVRGRL